MEKINVLMFGPHLEATSGISNVVNNWLSGGLQETINCHYVATLMKYVPGRYLYKLIEASFAAGKLLATKNDFPDLIHIHLSFGMSFYRKLILFMLARQKKLKIIIHLHGSEFEKFYYNGTQLQRHIIRWIFDMADCILVLSKSWEKFVSKISINPNIFVLYNGVNLNIFDTKRKRDDNRINISFMGRLGARKGVYDLLESFEKVVAEAPNAHLIIGGDGDIKGVKRIVAQKKLIGKVDILGWVSGKDKVEVFRRSDIYVLPSYNEGLPGSILEAMSVGLPIVSTPVGGIPECVFENYNGFLVTPGAIQSLADRLLLLCFDSQLRVKMGEASHEIVQQKFDIEKCVSELYQIYKRILSL